jgi:hypothetical protein
MNEKTNKERRRFTLVTATHRSQTTRAAMDDETFERVSDINDRLIQLCYWLNSRHDIGTASRLIPITDDFTRLVAKLSAKRK